MMDQLFGFMQHFDVTPKEHSLRCRVAL